MRRSWLMTDSKSPWYSNLLASSKFDAFCEILINLTAANEILLTQEIRKKVFYGSSKILKILHDELSIIESADEPANSWIQSVLEIICRPDFQLLSDDILEGDLIYKVASESLLKNGLNSLGSVVSEEVLSYVKFSCCVLRLCWAGMSLTEDERNKEARCFMNLLREVEEDGVKKRWFLLRDLPNENRHIGLNMESIVSHKYQINICKSKVFNFI